MRAARIGQGDASGNLANGGEIVKVEDAQNSAVLEFQYEDGNDPGEEDWHRETDGAGFSLVTVDETGPLANWESGSGWRSSALAGGSPGQADSTPLVADGNGDGAVDTMDFAIWNANKFTVDTYRTTGDYNLDGVTDVRDFNVWNANRFLVEPAAANRALPKIVRTPRAAGSTAVPTRSELLNVFPAVDVAFGGRSGQTSKLDEREFAYLGHEFFQRPSAWAEMYTYNDDMRIASVDRLFSFIDSRDELATRADVGADEVSLDHPCSPSGEG